MKAETKRLDNLISDNRKEQGIKDSEIQKSIVDLKSRSMRDNLVFCGIHEERDEDDCEQVVRKFLRDKLKITDDISFERVHRIGKPNEFSVKPRNIVAKFSFYKDRELVRRRAPMKLKGSNIWVNEQFPPEIEEKRRKLYPALRKARKDKKRVKLVVDRLYIEGELYVPSENMEEDSQSADEQSTSTSYPVPRKSTPPRKQPKSTNQRKRQRRGSTPNLGQLG
jgi:hypothetical protein